MEFFICLYTWQCFYKVKMKRETSNRKSPLFRLIEEISITPLLTQAIKPKYLFNRPSNALPCLASSLAIS